MVKKLVLLGWLALFSASFAIAQEIDMDNFYEDLSSYGEWLDVAPYGWVWSPTDVEVGWKPYAEGWWVYTDYGWTFESDEPWAWAVYHYGRWLDSEEYGWIWVPGTEWGPAWVAWRYSDYYIGWAPLPPVVGWSPSTGLVFVHFSIDRDLPWTCWIFVEPRWFPEHRLRDHHLHPARNKEWMRRTTVVTHYPYVRRKIYNPGYPIKRAEKHWGKPIDRHEVVVSGPDRRGPRDKGRLPVYKPAVKERHTITPRDLPDKRKALPPEEVRKKQEMEKRKLDDFYGRQKKEIQAPPPVKERPKKGEPAAKPDNRNLKEEAARLDELERKDKRVLDSRQKRELEKVKKPPRK